MPADDNFGLEDVPLREEIDLLGEVMAVAAEATEHLREPQIDEVLGAGPQPPS